MERNFFSQFLLLGLFLCAIGIAGSQSIVFSAEEAEPITLAGHTDGVAVVRFSPDGKTLLSASRDKTAKIWDVSSASAVKTIPYPASADPYDTALQFSPDGKTLAIGRSDATLILWDVASGSERLTLHGHRWGVTAVEFSPDGKRLASGGKDKTVRLWDAESGELKATHKGHSRSVWALAFSPDGKILASGSDDETVRLWDVGEKSAQPVSALQQRGQWGDIKALSYSPDGGLLAVTTTKYVEVWNTNTWRREFVIRDKHKGPIWDARFAPQSGLLATCSGWFKLVPYGI